MKLDRQMINVNSVGILAAAVAGLVCLLVYLRALGCDFVRMDDMDYVVDNPVIRQLDWSLFSRALASDPVTMMTPLTLLTFAVDYHFWKLDPFGYHLTNIVLHSLNVGLVVLITDRVVSQGQGSRAKGQEEYIYIATLLLAGLLWGLHPLRVESVAWVAERKDVLNGVFTLGAVLAYLHYSEKQANERKAWLFYLLSLGLFACSLMAKPVSVVLPFMLLVLDWFPLARLNRINLRTVLLEKVPYLLLSAISALVTLKFGAENSLLISADNLPFTYRIVIAGNALLEYYRFMLIPVGILPLFVLPNPIPYIYAFKAFVGIALTVAFLVYWRKYPVVASTWLLFILPIILVSGLLQNGMQALAARYTYLPGVPVSIAAAAGAAWLFQNVSEQYPQKVRWLLPVGVLCLLLFYGGMSWHLIGMWKDTATYWSRVIDIAPESYPPAYFARGKFYYDTGRFAEAVKDLSVIIESDKGEGLPKADNVIALRGGILAKMGRYEDALADYDYAISVYPEPAYLRSRGRLLEILGRNPVPKAP